MCRPRTRPAAQSGLQMPSTRLGRWSPGGSRHCVGRRWRPRATSARVWGRTAARRTARHWTAHLAHGSDGRGGGTRLIWVSLRTARRPRGGGGVPGGAFGLCPWASRQPSAQRAPRASEPRCAGGCVRRVCAASVGSLPSRAAGLLALLVRLRGRSRLGFFFPDVFGASVIPVVARTRLSVPSAASVSRRASPH